MLTCPVLEVERAYENFYKSGKSGMFNPVPPPGPGRREPMMMGGPGRDFPGYGMLLSISDP